MDRGYLDFARLFLMHQSRAFFVIRAKKNLDCRRLYSHPVDKSTGLQCDQEVMLNGYQATVGTPDWAAADLRRYLDATAGDIRAIAREVLDPNARVILRIVPEQKNEPDGSAAGQGEESNTTEGSDNERLGRE